MSGAYGGDLTPCDTQYWDEFYAGDAPPFEWYTGAGAVVEEVYAARLQGAPVLQVGCGNSEMAQELMRMGAVRRVVSVDLCEAALQQQLGWVQSKWQAMQGAGQALRRQRKKCAAALRGLSSSCRAVWMEGEGISHAVVVNGEDDLTPDVDMMVAVLQEREACCFFSLMDVCDLSFPDALFSCVLDKGTLDALISVDEPADSTAGDMLREVWRVLQPGGLFLLISGQEEGYVASFLEALPWESRSRQPVLSDKDRSAGLSQEESPLGLWTCVRAEEDPAQGSSSEGWWS